jgi:hypothetical protein
MKKIFSVVMVALLFYSFMGFYLNFEIAQFRIKEEIKEKIIRNLPESELTLVRISTGSKEKINWIEEGREFRYHGSMFDVVKIKKGKNTTYYYCYNDVKESTLLANLDKLVKEQTDNSRSRTTQKKHEITYFVHQILFAQCIPETPVLYLSIAPRYTSIHCDVLSPPPRIQA